ncbi:GDSL-type esterase/lipase family protein [Rhodococcoides yunnanense]|uniref:GDSL-type esterase/lipase family protein n=1 Tax=Rhodococcoides yunnanense TaxID=278209 RepID=UPI000934D4A7|nr:SGNH/GDSL hydrolase family protein [Rhodococcus yunnanensis]
MIITPLTAELVHGAIELESTDRGVRPHRLPQAVRDRDADRQLTLMEAQPSGVRVAFVTSARSVTLEVHATRIAYRGTTRARGAIDVLVDDAIHTSRVLTQGDIVELDLNTGASAFVSGTSDRITVDDLPHGAKRIEMLLPHNEQVDLIALYSDSEVKPATLTGPLWLHHGSSISQGSNASSPAGIWPAIAAQRAGVRLHNLSFGGSALVDPFMARVIRDSPADLISAKLGINVVNFDAMRLRSFVPAVHGFLDTIRDGHPTTPVLLVSPIFCGIHENTPGPGAIDPDTLGTDTIRFTATGRTGDTDQGRLTLQVVRTALQDIVTARADDPNLHYLDGQSLYGESDAEVHPIPDAIHPDSDTHALIGERFADLAFGAGGVFERESIADHGANAASVLPASRLPKGHR